jgi:hypothetical protein
MSVKILKIIKNQHCLALTFTCNFCYIPTAAPESQCEMVFSPVRIGWVFVMLLLKGAFLFRSLLKRKDRGFFDWVWFV